ncbi:hypothetical protein ACQJBY_018028 [Aegilops geniculata]
MWARLKLKVRLPCGRAASAMYVSSKKGTALEEHNNGIVDAGSCGTSQERGRRRAWQRRALDMQIMK